MENFIYKMIYNILNQQFQIFTFSYIYPALQLGVISQSRVLGAEMSPVIVTVSDSDLSCKDQITYTASVLYTLQP